MILSAAVILASALAAVPPAAPNAVVPSTTRDYHVRSTDPHARQWIDIGAAKSRTFNELLNQLIASDVIVYVERVRHLPGGIAGHLMFVASTPGARYLRIEINDTGRQDQMVALLGHELQHAVEVATDPSVRDSKRMSALYARPLDNSTAYDSEAARVSGERVRIELASARNAKPAPVLVHNGSEGTDTVQVSGKESDSKSRF